MSDPAAIDPGQFRRALGCFATGVCIATCRDGAGRPVGITVNSFTSVSLDPPLVLFCLDRGADSFEAFTRAGSFAITVLEEGQRPLSDLFARKGADRFTGLPVDQWQTGAPIIPGGLAAFDCARHAVHDGGDHVILVGRVLQLGWQAEGRPLLYVRGRYGTLAPG